MWCDVAELRQFYGSHLGQMTRHLIRRQLRELWPDLRRQSVLGLGYATPYLGYLRDEAERVLAFMPAQQGVVAWPGDGRNLVGLVDETELPLPSYSIDRILLVHSLECGEQLRDMLRECWRVMSAGGRLLAVVPNRRGIWARTDRTPFGQGIPYSPSQLQRLMRESMFVPTQTRRALYIPPTGSRAVLRAAPVVERLGRGWFQTFSGVVLVEAEKQIYAASIPRPRKKRRAAVVLPFPRPAAGQLAPSRFEPNRFEPNRFEPNRKNPVSHAPPPPRGG
jgi:SAM-dependent methyltransferase